VPLVQVSGAWWTLVWFSRGDTFDVIALSSRNLNYGPCASLCLDVVELPNWVTRGCRAHHRHATVTHSSSLRGRPCTFHTVIIAPYSPSFSTIPQTTSQDP